MGLKGWYPFIRKKGYEPTPLHHSVLASHKTGRRRFDVLGACFRVIRDAYNNNSQETAHRILEKDIEKFGSALNMTLYVDGPQALEKSGTAET